MMMKTNSPSQSFCSLEGQLLLAMPTMDDLRFERAVIYIYRHTQEEGAFGVVINRPADRMSLDDILEQLQIDHPELPKIPDILLGGPDQITRGFILHTSDYHNEQTTLVTPEISISANQHALIDIIDNRGPSEFLIVLGCASWTAGQLEDEIAGNVWLTAPATKELIFRTPYAKRWEKSLQSIGITPAFLSHESGNV